MLSLPELPPDLALAGSPPAFLNNNIKEV